MSIRAKILSILIGALVLSFVVSSMAYFHSTQLDDDLDVIIEEHLPLTAAAEGVRDNIAAVQAAEARMVKVDDASYRAVVDESLGNSNAHIYFGQRHETIPELRESWDSIAGQTRELKRIEVQLADLIGVEVREIQGQQRRLAPRISRLRRDVDSLAAELEAQSLELRRGDDDARAQGKRYARAARSGREAAQLLGELEDIKYSASQYEAFAPAFQRQLIPRYLARIAFHNSELREVLEGTEHEERADALTQPFESLAPEIEEVNRRVFDVNGRLVSVREDTQIVVSRIQGLVEGIEQRHLEAIGDRRVVISQRKTRVGVLILGFLIISVLFVGGLALVVIRSISNNVVELLRASRRLQRGDLDARVAVAGKDELQEVGSSFNAMAQYLQTRRKRQNDYNEIVTLLNSSIGVNETINESLGEVVARTGSIIGAIYLVDEGGERLVLAEGYGLDTTAAARRTVNVGEGVIGQVARNGRMAVVKPVPEGTFDIDLGAGAGAPASVLILPLVHVDVLLGVLILGSTTAYNTEDIRFIEEVVFQVAVAISNAVFYQTMERTAEALKENHAQLIEQQEDLERVNQRLEEANRVKSEFLANVTHELRTPLNSIIGFTDLVMDGDNLEPRQRKNLSTVLRNAENLLRLINDLLDISKMESGSIPLQLERFDLKALIEEAVEVVRPMAGDKLLELQTDLGELPSMYSDRLKTKQILTNLLSNAVKFTETGSIFVEAEVVGQKAAIYVRDSGIGMRSEDLAVIFDKFRQLDGSTSRKYGGTGLGLAITRQLCTSLGGSVSAASVPGEGSTFTVKLPIRLVLEDFGLAKSEDLAVESGAWDDEGGRPFVLVIDDDPITVVTLREGLRETGLEVKSAFTAQDAVDILSQFEPVCVVIGAALPDEDGASVMREVWDRIKSDHSPVLLIWDGKGNMPLFGYPTRDDKIADGFSTSDLSDRTIARVMGRIARPIKCMDLIERLTEHGLMPTTPPQPRP